LREKTATERNQILQREAVLTGDEQAFYKLDGDTLIICLAHPPAERPTEFTTPRTSGKQFIALKGDKK